MHHGGWAEADGGPGGAGDTEEQVGVGRTSHVGVCCRGTWVVVQDAPGRAPGRDGPSQAKEASWAGWGALVGSGQSSWAARGPGWCWADSPPQAPGWSCGVAQGARSPSPRGSPPAMLTWRRCCWRPSWRQRAATVPCSHWAPRPGMTTEPARQVSSLGRASCSLPTASPSWAAPTPGSGMCQRKPSGRSDAYQHPSAGPVPAALCICLQRSLPLCAPPSRCCGACREVQWGERRDFSVQSCCCSSSLRCSSAMC